MTYAEPTHFTAGSEEKIRILAERARAGLPLFVEGDSRELGRIPDDQTGPKQGRRGAGGIYRHGDLWRARPWCHERGDQVNLGLYRSRREAVAAIADWESRGRPVNLPRRSNRPARPSGVTWHRRRRKWMAQLWNPYEQRLCYLGMFQMKQTARAAVERARAAFLAEKACTDGSTAR